TIDRIEIKVLDKEGVLFKSNDVINIEALGVGEVTIEAPKFVKLNNGKGIFQVKTIELDNLQMTTCKNFCYRIPIIFLSSKTFFGDIFFPSSGVGVAGAKGVGIDPFIEVNSIVSKNINKLIPLEPLKKKDKLLKGNNKIINLDNKKPPKLPLQFIDNIATPKTVSHNPFVIGINGLFALLYLLLFYFTGALFNSYFQEKGHELSINKKVASYWEKFWTSMYSGMRKILLFLGFGKNDFLKKLLENTENFLSKRGHKVNVLIGIFILGIINSIIVGSFDLSSAGGWMVIGLLIFATGLLTLMKDMVLYALVKREDRGLKMELIPSGYILASMIAVFVRITNIVPGIIFGSAVRMNSETTIAKRKVSNGRKLFAALLVAYIIGIAFWFSSIYIPEENLLNKFVLLNYFSISTDTFFTLLPFGLFWGSSILKDKKFKPYWFVFIFFATFTLFHTVFNTKGDFSQILSLQSHNMNLFLGSLFFWLVILGGFWYFHFYRKTKKIDY
ncbi:MAG: hypothetical protein Q8K26_05285, partial [Candidatus Gracilibacteria bacterium]|nr:hypothetical protein [Candidatus Gracilibacteria bacterium]